MFFLYIEIFVILLNINVYNMYVSIIINYYDAQK